MIELTVKEIDARVPIKVSNPWIWPSRPWQRIHVDFAAWICGGCTIKVDWVFPMSSITATATIRAFRFLFATHGLREETISDNGPKFVAQEMKDFLKSNGICQCLSSPYHPPSKGEAERAVRTFKEPMKTMENKPGTPAR